MSTAALTDKAAIAAVQRSKDEARAYYTKISKWYDWMTAGAERQYTASGLKQLGARLGESVLEIGFGTGYALEQLARAVGPHGNVCGVDISEGMVLVAEDRLRKAGMFDRVKLARADASSLQFPPDTFDGVLLSFVLELFDTPEIPVVLGEVHRVLRPGGRATIVSMLKRNQWSVSVYEWVHKKWPTAVDCRPIYAKQSLEAIGGFQNALWNEQSMWGLPLQVVTATKIGSGETPTAPSSHCRPTLDTAKWKPDEQAVNCFLCAASFNFFRRRHHCRACGQVVCGSCSSETLCVPGRDPPTSVRVCDNCYSWHPLPSADPHCN